MERVVMYAGWTTIVGVLTLACAAVWYSALKVLFSALKNTYYMGLFIRFWIIAVHRERRIEKRRYVAEMLRNTQKVGAGDTATEGRNGQAKGRA